LVAYFDFSYTEVLRQKMKSNRVPKQKRKSNPTPKKKRKKQLSPYCGSTELGTAGAGAGERRSPPEPGLMAEACVACESASRRFWSSGASRFGQQWRPAAGVEEATAGVEEARAGFKQGRVLAADACRGGARRPASSRSSLRRRRRKEAGVRL
jgi:hypothetical protein